MRKFSSAKERQTYGDNIIINVAKKLTRLAEAFRSVGNEKLWETLTEMEISLEEAREILELDKE